MRQQYRKILRSSLFYWVSGASISSGVLISVFNNRKKSTFPFYFQTVQCEKQKLNSNENNQLCKRYWPERNLNQVIENSKDLLRRIKDETSCPGISISVSVDGETVWSEGIGYSDVENRVPCHANTVMRTASISKPLAMVAVAKLVEEGKLDLDKPIQQYLPDYPQKTWKGEKVIITTRQLVSHLGGIRHYGKEYIQNDKNKETKTTEDIDKHEEKDKNNKKEQPVKVKAAGDSMYKEFFNQSGCPTISKALEMFKNDPLINKPGTEFYYTTHGWTLVSAVVEAAAEKEFIEYMSSIFADLGLSSTQPEYSKPLVYHRARQYVLNDSGRLENAAYVDNSCKWAGGGFISDAPDLVKFGNSMLYSFQYNANSQDNNVLPGYLKQDTIRNVWKPVKNTKCSWDSLGAYAMGWCVVDYQQKYGSCKKSKNVISHTGGAIGGSSVLVILPTDVTKENQGSSCVLNKSPFGIVVAILANMESVSLYKTAVKITENFQLLFQNHEHDKKTESTISLYNLNFRNNDTLIITP